MYLDLGYNKYLTREPDGLLVQALDGETLDALSFDNLVDEISADKIKGGKFVSNSGRLIIDLDNETVSLGEGDIDLIRLGIINGSLDFQFKDSQNQTVLDREGLDSSYFIQQFKTNSTGSSLILSPGDQLKTLPGIEKRLHLDRRSAVQLDFAASSFSTDSSNISYFTYAVGYFRNNVFSDFAYYGNVEAPASPVYSASITIRSAEFARSRTIILDEGDYTFQVYFYLGTNLPGALILGATLDINVLGGSATTL